MSNPIENTLLKQNALEAFNAFSGNKFTKLQQFIAAGDSPQRAAERLRHNLQVQARQQAQQLQPKQGATQPGLLEVLGRMLGR
jgi:hypothetical protein